MANIPEAVERVIEYEARREAPPAGIPAVSRDSREAGISARISFALEMEHVWRKSWVCAGTEEGLRGPGEYRDFRQARYSAVLLVRGRDRKLRCFDNTCRHRGAPVVRETRVDTILPALPISQLVLWARRTPGRSARRA